MQETMILYRFWNLALQTAMGGLFALHAWWKANTTRDLLPIQFFSKTLAPFFGTLFTMTVLLVFLNIFYDLALNTVYLIALPLRPFILSAVTVAFSAMLIMMLTSRWTHKPVDPSQKPGLLKRLFNRLLSFLSMVALGLLSSLGLCLCHSLFLPPEILFPIVLPGLSPMASLVVIVTSFIGLIGLFYSPAKTPNTFDFKQMVHDFINIITPAVWYGFAYGLLGIGYHLFFHLLTTTIPTIVIEIPLYGALLGLNQGLWQTFATPTRAQIHAEKLMAEQASKQATTEEKIDRETREGPEAMPNGAASPNPIN